MAAAPSSSPSVESPPTPRLDSKGRYHDRGRYSAGVIGVYIFFAIVVAVGLRGDFGTSSAWVPGLLIALLFFFLARYLSTRYSIDDTYLRAWRILGGRKVRLETIYRIEYASLRDLSPTGFIGSWGWHGRMWSPIVGRFDVLHTEPAGLLMAAPPYPLFISPRDVPTFARELSRRVRSNGGTLAIDVGAPGKATAPAAS